MERTTAGETTWNRDVFICFSKARPGEARVALAIKDALERLGLSAFEYEDWSWVASQARIDTDVDRHTLLTLLDAATVIVLITPHAGEVSKGTQVELDLLRGSSRAVIAVTWSPRGWCETLEPERFEGLNLIWTHEGNSTREDDVEDTACQHIGEQVAEAAWLAHQLQLLSRHHPSTAGALLSSIPEGPYPPLQNLRLVRPLVKRTSLDDWWPDALRLAELARQVGESATDAELDAYQLAWRDGRGIAAEELAAHGRGPLARTFSLFYSACSALLELAVARCGAQDAAGAQLERGLMLARFGRDAEARDTLQAALASADPKERARIHQALAVIHAQDAEASIEATDEALTQAAELEQRCLLMYQRGVAQLRAARLDLAIADLTFSAERTQSAQLSGSALLARALAHTKNGDDAAAEADYGRIIASAAETPRLAVMARGDRGRIRAEQGRTEEALDDWKAALEMADADEEQRFRILERRADLFERLGDCEQAASDYEAMAQYRSADRAYRAELHAKAAQLRGVSSNG